MKGLIKRLIDDSNYRRDLRAIRLGLHAGMKVIHLQDDGNEVVGKIAVVRMYDDGAREGFFIGQDGSCCGWKPAHTFLPVKR